MNTVLQQLLTGKDNETHDIGRWLAVLTVLAGIGYQGWAIYKGQPFDLQNFGVGAGALFTGVGAMLKLKEGTEP